MKILDLKKNEYLFEWIFWIFKQMNICFELIFWIFYIIIIYYFYYYYHIIAIMPSNVSLLMFSVLLPLPIYWM